MKHCAFDAELESAEPPPRAFADEYDAPPPSVKDADDAVPAPWDSAEERELPPRNATELAIESPWLFEIEFAIKK